MLQPTSWMIVLLENVCTNKLSNRNSYKSAETNCNLHNCVENRYK